MTRLEDTPRILLVLAASFAGGLAAEALSVPAGAVLGALLGAVAVNLWQPGRRLPKPFREVGKILLGSVVGLSFAPDLVAAIAGLLIPVSIAVATLIAVGLGVAFVLHRWFGWDLPTALYASTPGGLSELAISSHEAGAQGHIVVAVHTIRVVTVVLLGPPALKLLLALWPEG
jgi:membrane AbrB-like protein